MAANLTQPNIFTREEARAIKPPVGEAFKNCNSRLGWPTQPMDVWNMLWNDPQSNNPDACLPDMKRGWTSDGTHGPYAVKKKALMCRLLQKKYTHAEAEARCIEIHGTSFSGVFRSGRYWCFWRKG